MPRLSGLFLIALALPVSAKPKRDYGPFMDGVLIKTAQVPTGDMNCTTSGSNTHCVPEMRWIYTVRLNGEQLPLVPVRSKKAMWGAVATMGTSVALMKDSVLWDVMNGAHFGYRQESAKIRIRVKDRESMYEIYLGR